MAAGVLLALIDEIERKTLELSVLLSDSIDPKKLREAWLEYERLNPGQPRVEFISFEGHGFEAEAYDTPPDYDFRRILGQVLSNVDEFCTIQEIYQVGLKPPQGLPPHGRVPWLELGTRQPI